MIATAMLPTRPACMPSQRALHMMTLYLVILDYCSIPHSRLAAALRPYLPRLRMRDETLEEDTQFKVLLREAETDPVMGGIRDAFFNQMFQYSISYDAKKFAI